ncbi:MAG: qxtB [Gammaproteobacteria bacterium]|jgi:cytochrome d ubiquinol oxidase subunit II|nr:qxtB [Gammaproteobacteria bacterium]
MTLEIIWAVIMSFAIIMYVILDGFDLGIGILMPFVAEEFQRDLMISSIIPLWDGNETWLVFGAAVLYAAFPLAYSILLPALYTPIVLMLAALIFRGVTFEFRFKASQKRKLWDRCFSISSMLVAFLQGAILGTFVQGYGYQLPLQVSVFYWLTPFSIMTGVAVATGYALLGATWLIIKTERKLQNKMYLLAKYFLLAVSIFLIIVSLWTPAMEHEIALRWFSLPNLFYLAPLPIFTGIAIMLNFYFLQKKYEILPFLLSISLFIFSYIGFCISAWPYIVPRVLPFWQAAAPPTTLKFMLVGVCILLPLLIAYTSYAYWVFKGKIIHPEHHY